MNETRINFLELRPYSNNENLYHKLLRKWEETDSTTQKETIVALICAMEKAGVRGPRTTVSAETEKTAYDMAVDSNIPEIINILGKYKNIRC